jgi:hypothetical protein
VAAGQLADPRANGSGAGEPDLVDQPTLEGLLQASEGALAVGEDRPSTPAGRPPATQMSCSASADAAVYSAGFHTTALPASRAGTRYQEGTATGKFPAVTTATTPTGTRKVNSCLSGISLGTVCPYRRRPSPRKKSQVSMTSCTSPSASA